jgi:hypothetical protein
MAETVSNVEDRKVLNTRRNRTQASRLDLAVRTDLRGDF